MKPLNLTQNEATDILNHGDAWKARMDRLRRVDALPDEMLFAVKKPQKQETKRFRAAQEICALLAEADFQVADLRDQDAVLQFVQ